jgi:hypothetical protein
VDIALTSGLSGRHFVQITGAVAGFVLRHETNLINNIQTPKKVVRVGQAYLNVMTQIEARKDGKGTPINSQNKDARYLLTELNNSTLVKALFSRSNIYRTDAYSKSWKLTHRASLLNQSIKDRTIKLIESYNATQGKFTLLPLRIPPSICSGKYVNQVPGFNLPVEARSFNLPIRQLATLSVQSFLQIMNIAQPSRFPSLITIPLANLTNVDPSKGRTYNIFTRLRSSERKALGYYNYDISGGLQIISFNILFLFLHHKYKTFDDLHGEYPLILPSRQENAQRGDWKGPRSHYRGGQKVAHSLCQRQPEASWKQ